MSEEALSLTTHAAPRPGALDVWCRRRVHAQLATLREGAISLVEGAQRRDFGARESGGLRASIHVEDGRFYRAVALWSALGGAEAYMDGLWRSDDLAALLRILARNAGTQGRLETGAPLSRIPLRRVLHALRRNSRRGSRRNIAAHYDLGNAFFELFLDPTLTYSSGIFERPDATMEEASIAKYEHVCRKLALRRDHRVLEIGTGWGGFALHAAANYGARMTTATISREQYLRARDRVSAAGLADHVQVLLCDYRDLTGRFDRLVSIEMIEAVGHQYLGSFVRVCGERLARGGAMLLQAITVPDQHYAAHTRSVDFIKRYVFPGGDLVSVGAVNEAARRVSDLRLVHLEELTPHYAETLRRWRCAMAQNLPRIRALGLGERFLRMWEFYLCYCEAGFEERSIGLVQMVYAKP